jgi:D-alanyl-D-alanine carboxypeptidase
MKKSNVTIIAAVLIALHVLAFSALLRSGKDNVETSDPTATLPAPAPVEPAPAPEPITDFAVPELAIPVEIVEREPAQRRETIAAPGTREGYLRSDRPNRRTSKIYPELIGDPYRSAIVVNARTGKILYENRATTYCYPASVTKLMTMLIVLEQIDAGVISLTDKVKITKEVATIARALALHVAGTRAAFVDMMNQKARELGMNSTVYHTEHGLPPSDGTQPDISTAYDIAILSLAALRHPETLGYTETKLAWLEKSPIRKEKFMLANRNALVGKEPYPGCDGLKTGYHSKGGWSLTATAVQNENRVVSVVLGVANRNSRNATSRKLLDKGFEALGK